MLLKLIYTRFDLSLVLLCIGDCEWEIAREQRVLKVLDGLLPRPMQRYLLTH